MSATPLSTPASANPDHLPRRMAVVVFLAFALAYFFSALVRAITATLSPTLSQELDLDAGDLGLLAGGYFLGFALTQLPLAEAIGLSFIAPVIALYLAAVMLGETIGRSAIWASLAGLGGVVIIMAGRLSGQYTNGHLWGAAAVLFSAVVFAYNLILARKQAQRQADHPGAMRQHPLDGIMCLAGVRRSQDRRDPSARGHDLAALTGPARLSRLQAAPRRPIRPADGDV